MEEYNIIVILRFITPLFVTFIHTIDISKYHIYINLIVYLLYKSNNPTI